MPDPDTNPAGQIGRSRQPVDGGAARDGSSDRNRRAQKLFAPIASDYDRWSRILSLGQDPRWRRVMVDALDLSPDSLVADVAAGTGAVSRLLIDRGHRVIAVDQSPEMLARAAAQGIDTIQARAEDLPFPDCFFDGLTFTYLLRYVDDPLACMRELTRVVRPGGVIGMVEFGVPGGLWRPPWLVYTRLVLPGAGRLISPGWRRAGLFLGPSIDQLHRRFSRAELTRLWEDAGLEQVRRRDLSVGGGLVMRGRRR